jgi:chromosome transmission fidelity protein 18
METSACIPFPARLADVVDPQVNQQLVKSEDRVVLKKLVRAMLDLGISYVQDRNEDGQIVYKLDPPLDIFTSYNGSRAGDLPTARFNLRQLVSKELEAETLRRAGSSAEGADATRNIGDIMQSYKSYVYVLIMAPMTTN